MNRFFLILRIGGKDFRVFRQRFGTAATEKNLEVSSSKPASEDASILDEKYFIFIICYKKFCFLGTCKSFRHAGILDCVGGDVFQL